MIGKIIEVLENYEKEYRERERESLCKSYAGRADAFHEIWEIIANMESNSNPITYAAANPGDVLNCGR